MINDEMTNFGQSLWEWNQLQTQLKGLKAKEARLRKEVIAVFFPEPEEGTNTVDLPGGWKLKGNQSVTRKIDEAALSSVLAELPEGSEDKLILYKPSLKVSDYKKLNENLRLTFDEALIIKNASMSLTLVPPKDAE